MKDKLSWINTNNTVAVYINSDIYYIEETNPRFEIILSALREQNIDLVKALIDPIKYGLWKTKDGIGVIVEYQRQPFKVKVLIKNEFRTYNYNDLWNI